MDIQDIILKQTCFVCSEQYDAIHKIIGNKVDYLLKKIIEKKNKKIKEYEKAIEHFSELSERLNYYDLD